MKMTTALLAALRRDPEFVALFTAPLRQRAEDDGSKLSTVVQAAEALEPLIAEAVSKRPSRLNKLGLKSTHLLANLAADDSEASSRLSAIAAGSDVGIVFVDIADFTRFTALEGDDAAIDLLRRLDPHLEASTRTGKGEIVKKLGDGFLLAFPSPSQAVRGAVALRARVVKDRRRRAAAHPRLRLAVHSGEPLVEQDDLLGLDVNITAHLLDHCDPDEVVVSDPAQELARRRLRNVTFENRRTVKIRGLATPVVVWSALDGRKV